LRFEASPANSSRDPISKKTLHKKGLVEWLKVRALCSNPSTTTKKKKKKTQLFNISTMNRLRKKSGKQFHSQ
jgi:hypothetical protein